MCSCKKWRDCTQLEVNCRHLATTHSVYVALPRVIIFTSIQIKTSLSAALKTILTRSLRSPQSAMSSFKPSLPSRTILTSKFPGALRRLRIRPAESAPDLKCIHVGRRRRNGSWSSPQLSGFEFHRAVRKSRVRAHTLALVWLGLNTEVRRSSPAGLILLYSFADEDLCTVVLSCYLVAPSPVWTVSALSDLTDSDQQSHSEDSVPHSDHQPIRGQGEALIPSTVIKCAIGVLVLCRQCAIGALFLVRSYSAAISYPPAGT